MGESPIAAVPPKKRGTQTGMTDGVEESLERKKALCGHHILGGARSPTQTRPSEQMKSMVPLVPRLLAKRTVLKPSQGQPLQLSLTAKPEPALSPAGPKGSIHGSRKCVNPLPDKSASVLLSPVYLLNRSPEGNSPPCSQRGCGTSRSENLEAERNVCHRGCNRGNSFRSAEPRILPCYRNVLVVSSKPDIGAVAVAKF